MQMKRISIYDTDNTRERIVQIFDSIPDEILLIDTDMLVMEANASFLSNNNLTIDQVCGYPCYEVEQRIRGKASPPKSVPAAATLRKMVAVVPGAVGYVLASDLDASVRALPIDGLSHTDAGYRLRMK